MDIETAGLKSSPFRARGTPVTFVTYSSQTAATKFLARTRSNKRGMGLLQGPPKSGKTSLINNFVQTSISADDPVAVVDGAVMDEAALLQAILDQFGYDADFGSANERFNMVRVFANQQTGSGTPPFLVVENLHALEPSGLVALCELAALEVDGKSALRMILTSDQPMMPIVRKPAMKPILNRLTGEFQLKPMELRETIVYLRKKLAGAGCRNSEALFPQEVCSRLHMESGGLPGIVDRLASIALSKAAGSCVQIDDVPHKGGNADSSSNIPVLKQPAQADVATGLDASLPQLVVTFQGKIVQELSVGKPRFMIGRSEHNDLSIDHEYISRQHAVLVRIGNAIVLLDLKSRNETFVNGKRIDNQVLINDDIISIGDHRIKFVAPAVKQRGATPKEADDATTVAKSLGQTARKLLRVVGD
jgi:type II secretory pathway predicted ATPase ExeA